MFRKFQFLLVIWYSILFICKEKESTEDMLSRSGLYVVAPGSGRIGCPALRFRCQDGSRTSVSRPLWWRQNHLAWKRGSGFWDYKIGYLYKRRKYNHKDATKYSRRKKKKKRKKIPHGVLNIGAANLTGAVTPSIFQ